jgi:hypothetical protein
VRTGLLLLPVTFIAWKKKARLPVAENVCTEEIVNLVDDQHHSPKPGDFEP